MPNVFTRSGPAVGGLPKRAIGQSFKQKHPSNNEARGVFQVFARVQPPNPSERHDVGSEYADYMVVSPVKSAFRCGRARAGPHPPIS
jgi:hypothetical protein